MSIPLIDDREIIIVPNWIFPPGSYINRFVEAFSEYCDAFVLVVPQRMATTVLPLALAMLRIDPEDEFIKPTLTIILSVFAFH